MDLLKKAFNLFFPYLFKTRKTFLLSIATIVLVVAHVVVHTYVPYASKELVESLSPSTASVLFAVVGLWSGLWFCEKTFSYMQSLIFFPVINGAILDITRRLTLHVHHLPFQDYKNLSVPQLISVSKRVSLSARLFLRSIALDLIPELLKLITAIIIMVTYWDFIVSLSLTLGVCVMILIGGIYYYSNTRTKAWQATDEATARIYDSLAHSAQSRFHLEWETENLTQYLQREYKWWNKTNIILNTLHIVLDLIIALTLMGCLYAIGRRVQAGDLSLGDFILFKGQLLAIFLPLRSLVRELRYLSESTVDVGKLIALFEKSNIEKSDLERLAAKENPHKYKSIVTNPYPLIVNNITYGYPNHTPILKNVSLRIEKSQKILIQGASGAGKTTLGQILAGLIQPEHGFITIGELPMRQIPMSQLGQTLHYVPQNNQLFEQTLYFNLTYGLEKVDEDLLSGLIELFELKHLIGKGEGRVLSRDGLSGGERQRIAIIRALLHKPKILILDEALRSIDSAMNKVVLQAVLNHVETSILINHHSTDLELFDQVFEVKKGNVTLIKKPAMKKAS